MNAARARKLAVDVPSGLDADTGRAAGPVFRADVTATMGACKVGLYVDADAPVGRVEVVELGVPILADDGAGARSYLLDEAGVAARLPRRRPSAHKGSSGHLLVVAGAPGKTGAAVLVGQAALRAGAGLVTLASTAPGQAALDAKVVELMTARYTSRADVDADEAIAALIALAQRAQAIAIGPGIPTGEAMQAVVRRLASTARAADGPRRGRAQRARHRRGRRAGAGAGAARPDAAPGRDGPPRGPADDGRPGGSPGRGAAPGGRRARDRRAQGGAHA